MSISYNKLWKLLIDKKMSKADLRKAADISPNTMTKLRRDEPVSLAILSRVCDVLECDFWKRFRPDWSFLAVFLGGSSLTMPR